MNLPSFYIIAKEAASQQKMLWINYVDRFMNFSTRETEPYEIRGFTFFGYTSTMGASGTIGIRQFKIPRIREAWVSENIFSPRWEIKIV